MPRGRGGGGAAVLAALALCAAPATGAQRPSAVTYTLAITHARVIDGRGDAPIADGTVVVRGDRIVAVGPAASTPVPAGTRVIDGRGKSVLPGLADMHVHLTGGWDGERTDMLGFQRYLDALLYSGVTSVLDLGNVLPYVEQLKQEVAAGRVRGPRIFMAGPLIDGARPFWPPLSYAVTSPEQIPRHVKALKRAGVDVLKAYAGLSTEEIGTLVEAARPESLRVIVDAHARNGTLDVARSGLAAFAHVSATPMTDETIAYMREHGVANITTLAVQESSARRRLVNAPLRDAMFRDPIFSGAMPPPFVGELRAFVAGLRSPSDSVQRAATERRLIGAMANVKRLSDSGVLLVAGTDAPYPGDFYGEGLHRELELLVEAGLTPLKAIATATKNAALLLEQSRDWGTIEPGRRADLVVVAGDPSTRISDTRRIVALVQGGRVIDRAQLAASATRDPGYLTSGSVAASPSVPATPLRPQMAPLARPVAITDVTVVDVASGQALPARTVVTQGARIVSVSSAAQVILPPGALVIDGRGRFLIPGLWDMHSHAGREADLALYVANGVTGARIMGGDTALLGFRKRIANGTIAGPALYVAGPILEGPPPKELASVIATSDKRLLSTAGEAVAEVRAEKAAGYDFVKVYNNLSLPVYEALVAEARRLGMPVAGHVPFAVGLRRVLAARQASIEHMRGYVELLVPSDAPQQPGIDLRSRALAWRYADTARVAGLARETRDAGSWNVVTLGTRIYESPQSVVDRYLASPDSVYMSGWARAAFHDRKRIAWLSNYSADDFQHAVEGHARQDMLVRVLRDAGAGILAGTDIAPWGLSLHYELEYLVAAGLTPLEALRAATSGPAQFLQAADTLGAVAPGYRADLVLLDANPLTSISNTRRIRAVVVGGVPFGWPALDSLLARAR